MNATLLAAMATTQTNTSDSFSLHTNASDGFGFNTKSIVKPCSDDNVGSDSTSHVFTSHEALLYIVVVLLFYAFAMVILMVKYIRREREEAEMANYYAEYVSREKFRTPKYEIAQLMNTLNINKDGTFISRHHQEDEDFVSCLEVPLVSTVNENSVK